MKEKDKLELYREITKKICDANKEDGNGIFFDLLEVGSTLIEKTLAAFLLSLDNKIPDMDRMKYTIEVLRKLHESDTSNSPGNSDGSDSSL